MTAEGRSLKEAYQWQAKSQWKRPCITGNVFLTIYIYFPNKRPRDLDNAMKILLDSLSHIVYKDDKQITSLWLIKKVDPDNPRVDIDVQESA